MNLFGSPNIERMTAERDHDGLYKCLQHRNPLVRLQAAQALAGMEDGAGWRFLMDTVRSGSDLDNRTIAAAMLGELGHPRAVPVLEEALVKARFEMAQGEFTTALREALEAIGGPEAEEALRKAGYEQPAQSPTGEDAGAEEGSDTGLEDFDAQFVCPILPRTDQIRFLTAEQHLQNAVDLREAEQAERGLVEDSLALWLLPNWAYAWYIRGVLFEDLDREAEAILAYHAALDLDPAQNDARQALDELADQDTFAELHPAELLAQLNSRSWQRRRDAAAALGELFRRQLLEKRARNQALDQGAIVDALIEQAADDEREVRRAVIEALGLVGDHRAVLPLLSLLESSWLMRFTILEALSRLSAVDGLITMLRSEMNRIQDRNPVFSSHKDPLLEVEFDLLMEAGALALEKTGDIEGLLSVAESNTWEDIQAEGEETGSEGFFEPKENEDILNGLPEEVEAADEDLTSYVDEVALMALVALERLAAGDVPGLPQPQLERLAAVPDLTLIDPSDPEAEPVIVYDFSAMRQSAAEELARRGKKK